MRPKTRTAEEILAGIATDAWGVVTRAELLEAGVTLSELKSRIANGSLLREHRGVYRVGHRAPSVEASYLAAVRACGDEAWLRGLAAAHLWELITGPPPAPEVISRKDRKVVGISVRRTRSLSAEDVTIHRGIPVTKVARTLVDIAELLTEDQLALACHKAGIRWNTTPDQIAEALARQPNAPGAGKLKRVIHGGVAVTLSELEREFLRLLRREGLVLPEVNRRYGARRLDCRWREPGLTVELDGYRFHRSRHAWENDRRREREAYARGDQFRRYTYGDVFEHPEPMLRELRAILPKAVRTLGRRTTQIPDGH